MTTFKLLAAGILLGATGAPMFVVHAQAPNEVKGPGPVIETTNPPPAAPAPPYQRVFVLCVGVTNYPGLGNLNYAVADALGVSNALRSRYGFTNVTTLLDTHATKANISNAIQRIRASNPTINDDVIVFFSGHGNTVSKTEVREGRTNLIHKGYLAPYDAALHWKSSSRLWEQRGVDMQELTREVAAIPARHRLLFLDACFGGFAFTNAPLVAGPTQSDYKAVLSRPTVQVLTAGTELETVQEVGDLRHGLFTAELLRQIDSGSVATMEEVFFPLASGVRNYYLKQNLEPKMRPQHRYLVANNGTFVFVPVERMGVWTYARPPNTELKAAQDKGHLDPVTTNEIEDIKARKPDPKLQQDPKWNEQKERLEARAALGDPNAMAALAFIYGQGIDGKTNQARAGALAREGNSTLLASSAFGIKDPVVATLIDKFVLNGQGGNPIAGAGSASGGVAGVGSIAATAIQFWKLFGDNDPMTELLNKQGELVKKLTEERLDRYKNVSEVLADFGKKLNQVASVWNSDSKPEEVEDIRRAAERAKVAAGLHLSDSVSSELNLIRALLDDLKPRYPQKPKNP